MQLIVDAMFGAGLSRPLEGLAAELVRAANARGAPILAADVPSGLHGDLGRPMDGPDGVCIRATETVTFFRPKPGASADARPHALRTADGCGYRHSGSGAERHCVRAISPTDPLCGGSAFPLPTPNGHKYQRGHAVVVSGPMHATGAARLAARGALRSGAGLVSVASPLDAVGVNAAHLTAIMVKPFEGAKGLSALAVGSAAERGGDRPRLRTWAPDAGSRRGGVGEWRRCGARCRCADVICR